MRQLAVRRRRAVRHREDEQIPFPHTVPSADASNADDVLASIDEAVASA